MTAQREHNHETLRVATAVGFTRGLRMAAHIARHSGNRELAISITQLAQDDAMSFALANMGAATAQVTFAAAVADCMGPIPGKPVLRLVEGGK